ncbi:hypothetical protein HYH03_009421 [Edaphochlamys debaryana]|uniref:Uncharacterized protein n=1 Tax=Edaphochlamys debaryana TaxID=47281 RepID=A0A835XYX6_9CHLO|nr:hypothetical protein HYH03_009421 [Edaphochlamys debaryana]|eukprot:KAG2492172.1 hypothetical protein HYH03_009421 [Edaphochlamys debaryana]
MQLQTRPPATGPSWRPARRALQVLAGSLRLHRKLQQPRTGPISSPEEVTYECLALLRRPDLPSLLPFFSPGSCDPSRRSVELRVGGQAVEEAGPLAGCSGFMDTGGGGGGLGEVGGMGRGGSGPLAGCSGFMDTAARRVLPGHLLRRCRVLSALALGDVVQQRVALTACTGEESVFTWRLRRRPDAPGALGDAGSQAAASSSSSSLSSSRGASPASSPFTSQSTSAASSTSASATASTTSTTTRTPTDAQVGTSASGTSPSGSGGSISEVDSDSEDRSEPYPISTAWIVESIARDDSMDEQELPQAGPLGDLLSSAGGGDGPMVGGGGPHPRWSPELVVKAQLAALRRGDVVGASSFNLWSRSTSGGWDLHLRSFRALLQQPPYTALLAARGAALGPAALASGRRQLQEVELLGAGEPCRLVYQLGMQANGCWVIEAIRAV